MKYGIWWISHATNNTGWLLFNYLDWLDKYSNHINNLERSIKDINIAFKMREEMENYLSGFDYEVRERH